MLEYDNDIFEAFFQDGYDEAYCIGHQLGILPSSFKFFRKKYKKLCKKYNGDMETIINRLILIYDEMPKEMLLEILDFVNKYERMNDEKISKRYILESEYLPWRDWI